RVPFTKPFAAGVDRQDSEFTGFRVIPFAFNAVDPKRILIGSQGLYELEDKEGGTVKGVEKPPSKGTLRDDPITALAYGGKEPDATKPPADDVVYVARANNIAVRKPGQTQLSPIGVELVGSGGSGITAVPTGETGGFIVNGVIR